MTRYRAPLFAALTVQRMCQGDTPINFSVSDYIAFYAAALSTVIAVVAVIRWVIQHQDKKKERRKFASDLYFLKKIDRSTKEVHPIVVALLANLGSERFSFKSLDYSGESNGMKTSGSMGWYEQPEELFGIRNRLLPVVLEAGQTADLPLVQIGVLTRVDSLKMWLTDFDDQKYYFEQNDIDSVRREIEKYQESKNG